MQKLSITGTPVLAAVLAAGMLAAPGSAMAQKAVTLGTSSIGSTFYVLAVGMSKIMQKYSGINVAVESVGGSHSSMFSIRRGKIDIGMANAGANCFLVGEGLMRNEDVEAATRALLGLDTGGAEMAAGQ